MSIFEICPNCNSDNVAVNLKRREARCEDCGHQSQADVTEIITPNGNGELFQSCRDLANANYWCEEVVASWPGPIAHEYRRLKELLDRDQTVGAVWKLKDLAEVLTRYTACIMACDVSSHSPDTAIKAKVREGLLGKVMTMGGWHEFANMVARHMQETPKGNFVCPHLATIFLERDLAGGKLVQTGLSKLLIELTEWRNSAFAHGALRLDLHEFIKDMQVYLPRLNQYLLALSRKNIWHDCILIAADGTRLMGASSIRKQHERESHEHTVERIQLAIHSGKRELPLDPYAQLRRCGECNRQDVFLFDWRKARKNGRDLYRFIDYLAGHHIESFWWKEDRLHHEALQLDVSSNASAINGDTILDPHQAYLLPEIAKLLVDCSITKQYLAPNYLRNAFVQFVQEKSRGIWWLKAPGHIGKSTFIAGIDPKLREHFGGETLVADACVAVFYIRRGYQTGLGQFSEQLYFTIKDALGIITGPGGKPVRQLDIAADEPAAEFSAWLSEFVQAAKRSGRPRRLIVCIDGLDELLPPEVGQLSIVDFLTPPNALPDGVYLALTSRPDAELADWLLPRLSPCTEGTEILEIGLQDKNYTRLMFEYFKKRLKHRVDEAQQIHGHTKETASDLKPLFEKALEKSGGRFLYLSYLTDRLADGTLKLDSLRELPTEDKLFSHFFDEIRHLHRDSNLDDYFERLLLHLAAAEQAFNLDRGNLPAIAREDNWQGLPIEVLSRRMDSHPDGKITLKLVYALHTLKPVLSTWRGGDDGQENYRLGVKGLADLIGDSYRQRLVQVHAGLIAGLVGQFGDAQNKLDAQLDQDMELRLRYATDHANLGGSEARKMINPYLEQLTDVHISHAETAGENAELLSALRWFSAAIGLLKFQSQYSLNSPQLQSKLANAYMHRGVVLRTTYDLSGALSDSDMAINLHEALRFKLGQSWSSDFVSDLATAYKNRGNVLRFTGARIEALADFNTALMQLEALRSTLGDKWSPEYANELALAYNMRGVGYYSLGRMDDACGDISKAIEIREHLRVTMGETWPDDYVYGLSASYLNLGAVCSATLNYSEAQKNYSKCIDLLESLHQLSETWIGKYAIELSKAYSNRSTVRRLTGDNIGALTDSEMAVLLSEEQRALLDEHWPAEYAEQLATAYVSRGKERNNQNDVKGALTDYAAAIDIRKMLLENHGDQLLPSLRHMLMKSHIARGSLHIMGKSYAEAISDYDTAIELGEAVRSDVGEQQDLTELLDTLAGAYSDRGIATKACGDILRAITDYDTAIDLRHMIRAELGDAWWGSIARLAQTYINRGVAKNANNDYSGAIADYDTAIDHREAIRMKLGEQWQPKQMESLAAVYQNRGVTKKTNNDFLGAIADCDTAIDLRETIRIKLGEQWQPEQMESLAAAYQNRGVAKKTNNDCSGAIADYDVAIDLREAIRLKLGEQWQPEQIANLAAVYLNRGLARYSGGDAVNALSDYDTSISLQELSKEKLGSQWLPEYEKRLKASYKARDNASKR